MNRIVKRMAVPVGAAIILGSSGFAFMASNAVQASQAGDGSGTIAGYAVTNVHYQTDNTYVAGNGDYHITAVSFDLNGPAQQANVRAVVFDQNGGHVYYSCSNTSGWSWTCARSFTGGQLAQMSSATKLEVTAAQ